MAKNSDRLISIDEYICEKYASAINDLLIGSTVRGFAVRPGTAEIKNLNCWAKSDTEFGCSFHYSGEVFFDTEIIQNTGICGTDIGAYGYIDGDEITCEFYPYRNRYYGMEEGCSCYLDKYLIPKADIKCVSRICEEILRDYVPNEFRNGQPVRPSSLAKAMGLEIVHHPLYRAQNKRSLLVLNDSRFPLYEPVLSADDEIIVSEGSIVINTLNRKNFFYEEDSIAHECYHYGGQRLFNAFQKVAHREFPRLGTGKIDPDQIKSLRCLEWQAMMGATFLRYPVSFAKPESAEALQKHHRADQNQGQHYEDAIRSISERHCLPATIVKRTMKLSGMTAAKGAWNFVDGSYIKPFAFDTSKCRGSATFVVSMRELMRLYTENDRLREAMTKGTLVYADGHVCVNSPEFVVDTPYGKQLTKKALGRMDDCCLTFHKEYIVNENGEYEQGILCCDDEQFDTHSRLCEYCGNNDGLMGMAFDVFEKIRLLSYTFSGTLTTHRENRKLSKEQLSEKAHLERNTVGRIENRKTMEYQLSTVIKLAMALKLSRPYAYDFFKKAGFAPDNTPAGHAIDFIISNLDAFKFEMIDGIATEYNAIARSITLEDAKEEYVELEASRKRKDKIAVTPPLETRPARAAN